ncbi:c-type cytochrome [Flavisolibacter tropicus]|uniref:Cytochrome c domain-containing protein n=1 Tax=Flavisolibacter tropicus TaxID=1492898 RepID=A0A172TTP2_9BACT|nr:hypothetical protein [Flavisolibacter tropicus]ANE50244.1 hypothetical protein SY85_06755 [Flavisolibacter tropicus]
MRRNLSLIKVCFIVFTFISCSKGGGSDNTDPCAGVTVLLTGSVTSTPTGQSTGSIVATASGGTGFTYSLNSGAFQSSGTFNNLAAGTYTLTAKNSNGCTGSQQFTVTATTACIGTTISISSNTTSAVPCGGTAGSITVTASGSTGFTYSINNGAFQSANTFTNLNAGNYSVVVKDANGCTQTASATVSETAAGPLFTAVRNILQANCVTCHNNSNLQGGMNWTIACNIVEQKARIKARAVDAAGTPNQMPLPPNPALSVADRQKIVDWINAGGTYAN